MSGFYYLASPYSKYPGGPEAACADVSVLAARLFKAGVLVFSPIAHTHAIATLGGLAGHFDQWADFDEAMLLASRGMLIATMAGWRESAGIAAEIKICERIGKPVSYISTDLDFITEAQAVGQQVASGDRPIQTTGYFGKGEL